MDCGIDGQEMNTHAEINRPFKAPPRLKLFSFSAGTAPDKCRGRSPCARWATADRTRAASVKRARLRILCVREPYLYTTELVRERSRPCATSPVPLSVNAPSLAAGHPVIRFREAGSWDVPADLVTRRAPALLIRVKADHTSPPWKINGE